MLFVPRAGRQMIGIEASWGTTRPATNFGTSVTPAVGSKGSWAAMGSALAFASVGLLININSNAASVASRETVVDIGIDPAGGTSFTPIIQNLLAGGANTYLASGGVYYYFPIYIPAGARIGARAQGTVTTAIRCNFMSYGRPSRPELHRTGSYVETLGITGTAGLDNTNGGTTAEGGWNLIGTTTRRCWWWQFGLQVAASDTAWNAAVVHMDLAIGDGSNKHLIAQDVPLFLTSNEAANRIGDQNLMEWHAPAGSSIYARLQSSGNLDPFQWAAWGLGG